MQSRGTAAASESRSCPPLHLPYAGRQFDELNSVTLGGEMRPVVARRLKHVVDDRGTCRLHDLETDPAEPHDLSDDPDRREDLLAMRHLPCAGCCAPPTTSPPARTPRAPARTTAVGAGTSRGPITRRLVSTPWAGARGSVRSMRDTRSPPVNQ